jgi:hypothetical protein
MIKRMDKVVTHMLQQESYMKGNGSLEINMVMVLLNTRSESMRAISKTTSRMEKECLSIQARWF